MKHQFQNMVPMWWRERTESPWLSSDLYNTHGGASWPSMNTSNNNSKILHAVSFLLEVGRVETRASTKGSLLSWGASLSHGLGTFFLPDLGSFPLKEEILEV